MFFPHFGMESHYLAGHLGSSYMWSSESEINSGFVSVNVNPNEESKLSPIALSVAMNNRANSGSFIFKSIKADRLKS